MLTAGSKTKPSVMYEYTDSGNAGCTPMCPVPNRRRQDMLQ